MGFDMVAICAVAFMVLLSIQWKTDDYLELILIFSLLGFSGTVAFVCYLGKNYHSDYDREKPPEGPNDR
jgi:multisubunit Na+/H+ antiporter MnhF subunit